MKYRYTIYGLQIESSRPLNLLTETVNDSIDLSIVWTTDESDSPDARLDWQPVVTEGLKRRKAIALWQATASDGIYTKLQYKTEVGRIDFLLDPSKKKLWIIHDRRELPGDLESYFVGPALGCILRLRGTVCLHSSVVNIDGRAVALLGRKMSGKSTFAAGFAQLGAAVLADDVAVLTPKDDNFLVQPGYSKVRLRPASANFLVKNAESLPPVYSDYNSRYFSLAEENRFCSNPLPLAAIYILGEIDDQYNIPFVETIKPREKLLKLLENTVGSFVLTASERAQEFRVLSQIARKVPVSKLFYAHRIKSLPVQCQTIVDDFRCRAT
jgi:hypothetical protein